MIEFSDAVRLARLQQRLKAATFHEIRKDGHYKSSEGNVSLSFNLPPVVGGNDTPYWAIEVFSYLLCPNARTQTWTGRTAAEAIGKAEDDIAGWCLPAEKEMSGDVIGEQS